VHVARGTEVEAGWLQRVSVKVTRMPVRRSAALAMRAARIMGGPNPMPAPASIRPEIPGIAWR
jgi:hypothetical protein